MTHTKVTYCIGERLCMISAKDHAGDSDAVCAGISAILYALAGWLVNNTTTEANITLQSGYASIVYDGSDKRAQAVFEAAVIGLLQIEKEHPKCLKIREGTEK